MTPEQCILADTYSGGEFDYVETTAGAKRTGDALFFLLWDELGQDGDTDRAEYIRRLERLESDILTIRHALETDAC